MPAAEQPHGAVWAVWAVSVESMGVHGDDCKKYSTGKQSSALLRRDEHYLTQVDIPPGALQGGPFYYRCHG